MGGHRVAGPPPADGPWGSTFPAWTLLPPPAGTLSEPGPAGTSLLSLPPSARGLFPCVRLCAVSCLLS